MKYKIHKTTRRVNILFEEQTIWKIFVSSPLNLNVIAGA